MQEIDHGHEVKHQATSSNIKRSSCEKQALWNIKQDTKQEIKEELKKETKWIVNEKQNTNQAKVKRESSDNKVWDL